MDQWVGEVYEFAKATLSLFYIFYKWGSKQGFTWVRLCLRPQVNLLDKQILIINEHTHIWILDQALCLILIFVKNNYAKIMPKGALFATFAYMRNISA